MQRFYGDFEVVVFKDGITVDVNKNTEIAIEMAAGGGWATIISKKKNNEILN